MITVVGLVAVAIRGSEGSFGGEAREHVLQSGQVELEIVGVPSIVKDHIEVLVLLGVAYSRLDDVERKGLHLGDVLASEGERGFGERIGALVVVAIDIEHMLYLEDAILEVGLDPGVLEGDALVECVGLAVDVEVVVGVDGGVVAGYLGVYGVEVVGTIHVGLHLRAECAIEGPEDLDVVVAVLGELQLGHVRAHGGVDFLLE